MRYSNGVATGETDATMLSSSVCVQPFGRATRFPAASRQTSSLPWGGRPLLSRHESAILQNSDGPGNTITRGIVAR